MSDDSPRFTVWVGGTEVTDHLVTEAQADRLVSEYTAAGYTDAVKQQA